MPGYRFFTNLHGILRVNGSFRVNREHLGRPGQRIVETNNESLTILKNIPALVYELQLNI